MTVGAPVSTRPPVPRSVSRDLQTVVDACRFAAEDSVQSRFAAGEWLRAPLLREHFACSMLERLGYSGLLDLGTSGAVRLRVSCRSINGIVSILPVEQKVDADFVHLNSDSFWLLKLAWRHGGPGSDGVAGDAAAELGTGNGLVAAYLQARYRRVVATDLAGPWLDYARLTLEANRARGRSSVVLATDVAEALRPESFDLVVSNPPWSPHGGPDADNAQVTGIYGGPTGTELPERFINQTAGLLKPGGTGVVLCLDPEYDDGRRPLHDILKAVSRAYDLTTELIDSEIFEPDRVFAGLAPVMPGLRRARHVGLIMRKL